VVALAATLSFAPIVYAIVDFPSQPDFYAIVPGCPQAVTQSRIPSLLTPANPVLLPRCGGNRIAGPNLQFSVDAPVDLRGNWTSTVPLLFDVANSTHIPFSSGPVGRWWFRQNGSTNLTLFPGTYLILFSVWGGSIPPDAFWVATSPIEAVFDRGMLSVSGSNETSVPSGEHLFWTLTAPRGATDLFFKFSPSSSACAFWLALVPTAVYQAWVSGNGPLNDIWIINWAGSWSGNVTSCVPYSNSTAWQVWWGLLGPYNMSESYTFVFWNLSGGAAVFSWLFPPEMIFFFPGTT